MAGVPASAASSTTRRSSTVLPDPAPAMIAVWRGRRAIASSTSSPLDARWPTGMEVTGGVPFRGEFGGVGCEIGDEGIAGDEGDEVRASAMLSPAVGWEVLPVMGGELDDPEPGPSTWGAVPPLGSVPRALFASPSHGGSGGGHRPAA